MEHLKTVRDKDCKEYQDLITRLNRIEGQVRGVKNAGRGPVLCGHLDPGQRHQQRTQCLQ